jgi:hypothetical protein
MYIDIKNLSIHYLDGTVISGAVDNTYDHENTKVLVSGSLTVIINKIKETIDGVRT